MIPTQKSTFVDPIAEQVLKEDTNGERANGDKNVIEKIDTAMEKCKETIENRNSGRLLIIPPACAFSFFLILMIVAQLAPGMSALLQSTTDQTITPILALVWIICLISTFGFFAVFLCLTEVDIL